MKALKFIALGLATLMVVLGLVSSLAGGAAWNVLLNLALSMLEGAALVLLLISLFRNKPALGIVAIAMQFTVNVIMLLVRNVVFGISFAGAVHIYLNWILTDLISLLPWVLALFAPRSKVMAIITLVLSALLAAVSFVTGCVNFVQYMQYEFGVLQAFASVSYNFSVACTRSSIAVASLWLALRKKAVPEAPVDIEEMEDDVSGVSI